MAKNAEALADGNGEGPGSQSKAGAINTRENRPRRRSTQDGTVLAGPVFIPKSRRESLRLSIDEYLGYHLLSARLWFKPDDGGELRPGAGGWAINVDKLLKIITELQSLEAEARAKGLLP